MKVNIKLNDNITRVFRLIHGPYSFFDAYIDSTYSLFNAAKKIILHASEKTHQFIYVTIDGVCDTNAPEYVDKVSFRSYYNACGLNITIINCVNSYEIDYMLMNTTMALV
jgi:dTDP-D-glucose 4,6-dehydratase